MLNRKWLLSLGAVIITGSVISGIYTAVNPSPTDTLAPETLQITSYRSPTCGCCHGWVEHLKEEGFTVKDNVTEALNSVKSEHNVPQNLVSCHTAVINGYVVEGHIPATDIKRLLREKPDVAGIAVPGMPIGSPGMESGDIKEPYTVFTFTETGETEVYQKHS
ncbi:protein of unknown function DUF411 [Halothece sp. PCC 7418]|uniref:DUF411 domain-containing protein n=1 Tax=Halothece sp. (strain PCC 7418) TaxID=65093 RepID=UPI0002A05A94|nr:DUF411 domain-containing protein [Halothece sp. PCC 7418]AFZ43885.1 protein of unknown function DUF411 [Halothece sp. PCC 7418]